MEYKIPEGIVEIDKEWVNKNIPRNITKVVCPSTLEKIGDFAFFSYENLEEIVFNDGLKEINVGAFKKTGLKKIITPNTLEKINSYALADCENLEEAILNEGLEIIDDYVFEWTNLKEIVTPVSIKKLGRYVFHNTKINKIEILKNVKVVEEYCFYNCCNLREVILDEGVEVICNYAFSGCYDMNIKKIIIPNSVKEISDMAFLYKERYSINGEVIIGSKSPIAKLSSDKLKKIFGPKAQIIIKGLEDDIDYNLFNNIKKVSEEERYRLGLELFDVINKDAIDLKKVQELLVNGADTEIRDKDGNTGLMLMIKRGNNEVSKMYLLSNCDINAKNKLKETPLILATRNNNNDIAFELIKRNCIVNAMTVLDESALNIAKDNGNIDLVSRLENILGIDNKERELEEVQKVRKKILGGIMMVRQ